VPSGLNNVGTYALIRALLSWWSLPPSLLILSRKGFPMLAPPFVFSGVSFMDFIILSMLCIKQIKLLSYSVFFSV